MFRVYLVAVLIGVLSSVSFAQEYDAESEVKEILAMDKPSAVEQLIDIALKSTKDAVVVIELVSKNQPRMLGEILQALSTLMSPADFSRAVEVAISRLGIDSDEAIYLAELKAEIMAAPRFVDGDTEVSAEHEQSTVHQRRTEAPGVVEDGSDGSSGAPPTGPGIPGLPSIFDQILDLLGIDPPASPS